MTFLGGIPPHRETPFAVDERVRVTYDVTGGIDLVEGELPYEEAIGNVLELRDVDYWTTVVELDDGRVIHFDPIRELEAVPPHLIDLRWPQEEEEEE